MCEGILVNGPLEVLVDVDLGGEQGSANIKIRRSSPAPAPGLDLVPVIAVSLSVLFPTIKYYQHKSMSR